MSLKMASDAITEGKRGWEQTRRQIYSKKDIALYHAHAQDAK